MESGKLLVVGHQIKIHLLSHCNAAGEHIALCGVRLDKVKKFSKKHQRKADMAPSAIDAGYCLKCRDTEKRQELQEA